MRKPEMFLLGNRLVLSLSIYIKSTYPLCKENSLSVYHGGRLFYQTKRI